MRHEIGDKNQLHKRQRWRKILVFEIEGWVGQDATLPGGICSQFSIALANKT